MSKSTKILVRAGLISALYVVLSLITFPIASGAIQFRISEALTLLPLFFIEAVPALFVGCLLSNFITGCMVFDVLFGSLITLVASVLTYLTGRIIKNTKLSLVIGGIFPVILNALFLPLIWLLAGVMEYAYWVQVGFLLISQALSVYLLGIPLGIATLRKEKKSKQN